MDTAEFEKYVKEIVAAYEEDAKNDEIRKSRFKKTYEKIYKSIPQKDKNEFFKFCIDDPMCGRRYFKSYGDFDNHMITDDNDDDEFDFGFLDDDEEDDENTIKSFKELAHSKNMSQEDLTAVLQKYGYFSSDGEPLKKWIDAGLFDKNKQFFGNTKEGKELFDRIIDKRHKYENYHIKKLLKESGYAEKDISFDKNTIIISGIKYKCLTSSELKNLDKTDYDNIEQLYLNLSLCRIAGQIQKDDNKEETITKDAGDDFSEWLDDDENIPESDELENNAQDVKESKEPQDEQKIKICPSCKTQMSIQVSVCPNCGLTCGKGTIVDKNDYDLDQKIASYKKTFSSKYNGIEELLDINKDSLIDKITSSIRRHSSTDLKEYLRDYSLNAKGSEIKSKYDKAKATNICAAFIVELLDGLKTVFDSDEIALKHLDKCSRSLDQLSFEKAKLAEKLKAEEKDSSEDDEFDLTNWDDDKENDTQNSKPQLTEKEKKFEQLKKEILSASDINKAIRYTLSNMPQDDWKEFNAYLLKDKKFRDALNKANPDKKEETTRKTSSKHTDSTFTLDDWDDDESDTDDISWDSDSEEEQQVVDKNQICSSKLAIIQKFCDDPECVFDDPTIEQIVGDTTNLILSGSINGINELIEKLLMNAVPGKDRESISLSRRCCQMFSIVATTCCSFGKILNNTTFNSFINNKISKYIELFKVKEQLTNTAIEKYNKKQKTKQNWLKFGKIVGKVAASPLIATAKVIQWSDEYSQRPEVQERRRQESIRYYCKFCGKEFKDPKSAAYNPCFIKARYDKALANLEGGVPPSHHYCQLYEGTQKSEYRCKRCGKTEKTIASLVLSGPCHPIHIVNIDKYNTHGGTSDTAAISLHEPAL